MSLFLDFLKQLAVALKFPNIQCPKSEALIVVMKESHLAIQIELDHTIAPGSILLFSKIKECEEQEVSRQLYTQMLQGNIKSEYVLSMNEKDHSIYLHTRVHSQIPLDHLHEVLVDFEKAVLEWRQNLKEGKDEEPKTGKAVRPSKQMRFRA